MTVPRALTLLIAMTLGTAANAAPDLYVMRHLQYRGTRAQARLTEVGANNARQLAAAFKAAPPTAIYAATEQVSLDTTAWAAIELGVIPKLFNPTKPEALMARLAEERGPVLVVASKGYAADLIARASGKAAPDIAEGEFGEIWRVSGKDRSVAKRSMAGAAATGPRRASAFPDEGEVADRNPVAR